MASSFTTSMRFELPATGSQQGVWGSTFNKNMDLIEEALGGYSSLAMTDGNYTISALYGELAPARNLYLNMTGTLTAARDVICPSGIEKLYIVKNATTGGFAIVFKPSGGTGVTIPNGETRIIHVQSTTAVDVAASFASLTGTETLSNKTVYTVASATGGAGFRIAHGAAPTSPVNGDVWTTTAALLIRINGVTKTVAFTDSNITGTAGNVSGTVAVANGGTGATTQSGARSNLGLGTLAVKSSIDLTDLSGQFTTQGKALLDDANAAAQRDTLELGDVAVLDAIGISQMDSSVTALAKTFLALTTAASMRTTLEVSKTGIWEVNERNNTNNGAGNSNYTLVLTDAGKTVFADKASNNLEVRIPDTTNVAFEVGTTIKLVRRSSGTMTIVMASGASDVLGSKGSLTAVARWGTAWLTKVTTGSWILSGDLE